MKEPGKRHVYEGEDGIYVGTEVNGNVVSTKLVGVFVEITSEKQIVSGSKCITTTFTINVYDSKRRLIGNADVSADMFMDMKWLFSVFGKPAKINPEIKGGKALLADFILSQSCDSKKLIVHKSPGFHWVRNNLVFVHESGILGEVSNSFKARGEFDGNHIGIDFGRRVKDPDKKLRNAIGLLELKAIGGDENQLIGIAAFATVIRSALTMIEGIPFSPLFMVGQSGSYKTSIAEIMQAFYGIGRCSQRLMYNLDSSKSDLVESIRSLSGSLLVVDDFLYKNSNSNLKDFNEKADLIIRGSANESFRETRSSNHSPFHPVIVLTGEHVPAMVEASLLARTVFVDATGTPLTSIVKAQNSAKKGNYANGMREFIGHAIKNRTEIIYRWERNKDKMCAYIKSSSSEEMHSRFPEQYAGLLFSCCEYLRYLKIKGYISEDVQSEMREEFKAGIAKIALTQKSICQRKSLKEAVRLRIVEMLETGAMKTTDDGMLMLSNSNDGRVKYSKDFCIGRLDENDGSFLFDANFKPADIFGSGWISANGLPDKKVSFYKRINDLGLLAPGKGRLTHRIRIGKNRSFSQFYKIKQE